MALSQNARPTAPLSGEGQGGGGGYVDGDDSGRGCQERRGPEQDDDRTAVESEELPVVVERHGQQRKREALVRERIAIGVARIDHTANERNEDLELDQR